MLVASLESLYSEDDYEPDIRKGLLRIILQILQRHGAGSMSSLLSLSRGQEHIERRILPYHEYSSRYPGVTSSHQAPLPAEGCPFVLSGQPSNHLVISQRPKKPPVVSSEGSYAAIVC